MTRDRGRDGYPSPPRTCEGVGLFRDPTPHEAESSTVVDSFHILRAGPASPSSPSEFIIQEMPIGTCPARRRDGKPCGARASSAEATFCAHHERVVELHGEEAVRAGRVPRRRNTRPEEPLPLTEEPLPAGNGNGPAISPSAIRSALATAAAEDVDAIRDAIREAALGAVRERWLLVECDDCGKKKRVQVHVPDVRARLDALELWLREALGRVAQAEEPPTTELPRSVEAVANLSWKDLCSIFAAAFVSEIAAAENDEGEDLLRERVAKLPEGERRVLAEALASAPSPEDS